VPSGFGNRGKMHDADVRDDRRAVDGLHIQTSYGDPALPLGGLRAPQ
jgi:hypothetical protein